MKHEFQIISFNVLEKTGTRKHPVSEITFVDNHGIEGDTHAGKPEKRQVSLVSMDEMESSRAYKFAAPKGVQLQPGGDFAENITTRGVVLHEPAYWHEDVRWRECFRGFADWKRMPYRL